MHVVLLRCMPLTASMLDVRMARAVHVTPTQGVWIVSLGAPTCPNGTTQAPVAQLVCLCAHDATQILQHAAAGGEHSRQHLP